MDAIRVDRPIAVGALYNIKPRAIQSSNSTSSSQNRSARSYQKDFEKVQQRISDSMSQFIESYNVDLDFEINHANSEISLKVINKASGEIIREIPVKPEVKIVTFKGAICQTIA